jgi:hypothetical protein
MKNAFDWAVAHWAIIAGVAGWLWAAWLRIFSKIADSLPAPIAGSSNEYIQWFIFVNNMAGNKARAQNLARVEDSPNFIPAAEAYMRRKLNEKESTNG